MDLSLFWIRHPTEIHAMEAAQNNEDISHLIVEKVSIVWQIAYVVLIVAPSVFLFSWAILDITINPLGALVEIVASVVWFIGGKKWMEFVYVLRYDHYQISQNLEGASRELAQMKAEANRLTEALNAIS